MKTNIKGFAIGEHADRRLSLEYFIHMLEKKIEEKPDGGIKKKGLFIPYTEIKKEMELIIRVWYD